MINALFYRPAEGTAENELIAKCSPYVRVPDNPTETEPVLYDRGLYFVSDIIDDPGCYRLPKERTITNRTLAVMYGCQDVRSIDHDFKFENVAGISTEGNRKRVPPPIRNTMDIRDVPEDGPECEDVQFHLQQCGIAVRPRLRMSGMDVDLLDESDTDDEYADDNVDAIVTQLWKQFPFDVFQLAPNHRSYMEGSYVLLDEAQRSRITHDIFKSLDLRGVFERVQYRIVDMKIWGGKIFDRYFPQKHYVRPKRLQQFTKATYYRNWMDMLSRLNDEDAELVRRRVRRQFNKLLWVPFPGSDRMWQTKRMDTREWLREPKYSNGTGSLVAIAINQFQARGLRLVAGELEDDIQAEEEIIEEEIERGEMTDDV